jgi:hypothetical protein
MRVRLRNQLLAMLLLPLCGAPLGCLFMPRDGTDVYVERRTGKYWSGEGKLVEVSPDERSCKVYVRTNALFVEGKWIDCRYVHARQLQ